MAKASTPKTGTDTVTVALKHPTGIVIEGFVESTSHEPVLGGGTREVKVFVTSGLRHVVNGTRVPFGAVPDFKIVDGYALTPGVARELWEKWRDQHADHPLLQNHLIEARDDENYLAGFAKEGRDLRHGLEAMNPGDDPRAPKRRTDDGRVVDAMEKANLAA